MTNIRIEPDRPNVKPSMCYVYIHRKISDGSIFYVGKGNGYRAWDVKRGRNRHWRFTAEKHGVLVEIYRDGLEEAEAYRLEFEKICELIELGIVLCNKTCGGKGGQLGMPAHNRRVVFCSNGMRFESLSSAEKWLRENVNERAASTNIGAVARGENISAYGFSWWYAGDSPKEYIPISNTRARINSKGVYCSNGMYFENMVDAVSWLNSVGKRNANSSGICRVINKEGRTAYGFSWKRPG